VKSEAQHRLTCWRIAAGPTTLRYVSCWPANEAVGKSSAVALDRTAYAACSPSEHVIAVERSPGTEMFSITARTPELSARIASRSSALRRDRDPSRSSIDGACAIIRW